MTEDPRPEPSETEPEQAPKPKKTRAKKSAPAAEAKDAAAKPRKTSAKSTPAKSAAKKAVGKQAPAKRKAASEVKIEEALPLQASAGKQLEDPIGDVSDGEAQVYTGEELEAESEAEAEAYRAGVAVDAVDGTLQSGGPQSDSGEEEPGAGPMETAEEVAEGRASEEDFKSGKRPPQKLERLQKILSQAGIASRRRAEEMIVAGRVMVNGQVVTALGSKADAQQDHIRVDGKLLQGAERHRYFVLNKPKGYVTTVSDPEGRPTVMDFVQKLGERVYPVGRLDYQSEGLLLMTNDGHLANLLTRAASGVEKTYLVKVAGQPDEEALERLRTGVMIERGGPSESGLYGAGGKVRTAPARVRQIRHGENPWFEVVLTEGRNRELRKMFSAIGHYVEKIRRVGYGPLVLDVAPGEVRELTLDEVDALHRTAEGKLKPRRVKAETMLPKEAGLNAEQRAAKPYGRRGPERAAQSRPYVKRGPERGPQTEFRQRGAERGEERGRPGEGRGKAPERPRREFEGERRQWQPRPGGERTDRGRTEQARRDFAPRREPGRGGETSRRFGERPAKSWAGEQRPFRSEGRPREGAGGRSERPFQAERRPRSGAQGRGERPFRTEGRPREGAGGRSERPFRSEGRPPSGAQGRSERPFQAEGRPQSGAQGRGERPFRTEGRPREGAQGRSERPFRSERRPPAGRWGGDESKRPPRAQARPPEARAPGRFGAPAKFGARGNSGSGNRGARGPARPGSQGKPGGFRGGPPRGGRPGGGKRRG
jgi:23S rRNA pseudouridine2605 synthase